MEATDTATNVGGDAARAGGCPVHGVGGAGPADVRKSARGALPDMQRGVEERDGTWVVRSYAAAQTILRASEETRQAGFNSESMAKSRMKPPVLFQDGEAHKEQRTAIARFFTPKTVHAEYRELMERLADETVADLRASGGGDLSALAMRLAVEVAARVVGLTDSRAPGMDRRLDAMLSMERLTDAHRVKRTLAFVRSQVHMLRFYLQDVRPAIRARRRAPREDVISHLLGRDYSDMEILIECITYGAAGMATTREFLCMAAWHLLQDDALRREYLAGDESARHTLLQEILRLEPVVGRLYRRATRDVVVTDEGATHTIPAGARIEVDLRAANLDVRAVGAHPTCPHADRERARGVQPAVLSFGDGTHRCPGAFIAIQESDIFLQRLLRLPLRIEREPHLRWNDLIESYELRDFRVSLQER